MLKNKKAIFLALGLLSLSLVFTGCKKENENGADMSKTYEDDREIVSSAKDSDFVLTTKTGVMQLYDKNGKVLDTLALSNSSKSDFIYCEDEGEIFSQSLLSKDEFSCILYGVDKTDGKLYIVLNSGNKLKVVDTINLKASTKIESIKSYNGIFYYLVKGNGISSKDFTVSKTTNTKDGVIDYLKQVGVQRRGKTYSYIYVQNLSQTYLKSLKLDSKLDDNDKSNLNLPDIKKETIMIPFDVDSWTVTNNSVLYCDKDTYGSYDLNTNILTACYGTDSSVDMEYRPGRYSNAFALNLMGEHASKSVVLQIDVDTLDVEKAIELNEEQPIDMYYDNTTNCLFIIYKTDNKSTYGKLKIYDLTTYIEVNNITFDFVPTNVRGHNGYYYVMNEFESFMVIGENGKSEYTTINKYIKETNTSDLLLCNIFKKDYFTYDGQGRYISDDGYLLDYRGNIVNANNQKTNRYGQILDNYGRAINGMGELVDKYGNIIDENGVIIKYTQQADGYYRSGNGTIIDETGKRMIKQEDGTYIKDVEEIPDLEWHYDEEGNVVIDADYLEKYPDAASWIGSDGKVTKGSYVPTTNGDEIEETADDTVLDTVGKKLKFWK